MVVSLQKELNRSAYKCLSTSYIVIPEKSCQFVSGKESFYSGLWEKALRACDICSDAEPWKSWNCSSNVCCFVLWSFVSNDHNAETQYWKHFLILAKLLGNNSVTAYESRMLEQLIIFWVLDTMA